MLRCQGQWEAGIVRERQKETKKERLTNTQRICPVGGSLGYLIPNRDGDAKKDYVNWTPPR